MEKNIIQEFLNEVLGNHKQFTPNKHFYNSTKIGRKRWGQIYRNEKSVTLRELVQISLYFGKKLNAIAEKRQLSLFTEDINKENSL